MPGSTEYTQQELRNMQQEAIRRVQEMQRRSRQTVQQNRPLPRQGGTSFQGRNPAAQREPSARRQSGSHAFEPKEIQEETFAPTPSVPEDPLPNLDPTPVSQPASSPDETPTSFLPALDQIVQLKNPIAALMEAFHIGHDHLVILFVLLMVLDSGTDPTLLLALIYLLF